MIPPHITELKKARQARCIQNKCKRGGYYCGPCRRLCKKLVKGYHLFTDEKKKSCCSAECVDLAAQEVEARLTYEYVFDMIDEHLLENGEWLDKRLRDAGHTIRLQKLCKFARHASDTYKWLFPESF